MSCIAGVGGNVPNLVDIARSGRPILALDGCALECTRSDLAERGVQPSVHYLLLNEQGVKSVTPRTSTRKKPSVCSRRPAQPCAACVGKPPQGRRTGWRTEKADEKADGKAD